MRLGKSTLLWMAGLLVTLAVVLWIVNSDDAMAMTCRQVNGDPMHTGLQAADAIYDSLPDWDKRATDRLAMRFAVSSMCQQGEDQTMAQIRDDIVKQDIAASKNGPP